MDGGRTIASTVPEKLRERLEGDLKPKEWQQPKREQVALTVHLLDALRRPIHSLLRATLLRKMLLSVPLHRQGK
jgi:hypothetical protein